MPRSWYESEEEWDDDDEYQDSMTEEDEYSDVEDEPHYEQEFTVNGEELLIPIEWKPLKLGMFDYEVSNIGKIRLPGEWWNPSEGCPVSGTPYRSFPVHYDSNTVVHKMMHHIVYEAFYGKPPLGWEVRHAWHVPFDRERMYSNNIVDIDIYKISDL